MSAERERSSMEAMDKLDYQVLEDLDSVLSELHDCAFGLPKESINLINRTLKKYGYKVIKNK